MMEKELALHLCVCKYIPNGPFIEQSGTRIVSFLIIKISRKLINILLINATYY